MSSSYVIPFDNRPISSQRGTNAGYTVPGGKFAKVTIHISHAYYHSVSNGAWISSSLEGNFFSSPGLSETIELWMKSGESINLVTNHETGSFTQTLSANWGGAYPVSINAHVSLISTISTGLIINGSYWKTVKSIATLKSILNAASSNNPANVSISLNCDSSSGWYAQEYAEIT
jgi:hypothetical protein